MYECGDYKAERARRGLLEGLLRVTKDVARKFVGHRVVGREVSDPVDFALVDEAHLGEVVAALLPGNFADLEGEARVFVVGLLPFDEVLVEGFVEHFVGLENENPIIGAVHGIGAGSDSGNGFADDGTGAAGGFLEFVVVGVDNDDDFVADAERVEGTFERAGSLLRVNEASDLGHGNKKGRRWGRL
jgi:hypothetical protein